MESSRVARKRTVVILVAAATLVGIATLVSRPSVPPRASPGSTNSGTAGPTPATSPSPASGISLRPHARLAGVALPDAGDSRALPRCAPDRVPAQPSQPSELPLEAGDVTLDVVGQLGGRVGAVALGGGRLYVGVGPRVVVLDRGASIREAASSAMLPDAVTDLAIGDGVIIAAIGGAGLVVLDGLPRELAVVGSVAWPVSARRVAVAGDLAFVAAGGGGLRIVRIADPREPTEVAFVFGLHNVRDVAVVAGTAYVAAGDEGLLVADVTVPAEPRELARLFTGGFASGVDVVGDRLYLADGAGGLRVIDVADPARPLLLGSVVTAGWAMDATGEGRTAYVAAGAQGLLVVDVGDPSSPAISATLPLAQRHADRVAVQEGIAYVVDPGDGLQIIDVRTPVPKSLATWQPLVEGSAIALDGDHAYIAAGAGGLRVVDLSDPAQPIDIAGLPTSAAVRAIAVVDGRALFVTGWDPAAIEVPSLFAADISGNEPAMLGPATLLSGHLGLATFPIKESEYYGSSQETVFGPAWSATVAGSVVAYAIELGIVLVDAGGAPCELAFLQTVPVNPANTANSVAIKGTMAYVGIDPGTYVVDIADPSSPRLVRTLDDVGAGPGLINGDWLYIVNRGTLFVVDVSRPKRPRVTSRLALPGEPVFAPIQKQLALGGGRLFASLGTAGLVAIDVSDGERPRIAGHLEIPGAALGLASDGSHLYVGSSDAGLLVVDWHTAGASTPTATTAPTALGGAGTADSWDRLVAVHDRPPPAIAPAPGALPARTGCTVTSTEDEGPGTLRECLELVAPGEGVAFDPSTFSPDAAGTIHLASGLMVMTPDIVIDGRGAVVLDGGGEVEAAFDPDAERVTIRGFRIRGFEIGVQLSTGANGAVLEDNIINGNLRDLAIGSVKGARVVGNRIGVDATGSRLMLHPDNVFGDLNVETGSSMNRFERNVFGWSVHVVDEGTSDNVFVGNRFGLDATGRRLACVCSLHLGEPFNQVGGSEMGEGNVIGGQLTMHGGDVALGNVIGIGPPVDVIDESPSLELTGTDNVVGGRSPDSGNRIQGRWALEIGPGPGRHLVIGNRIGGRGGAGTSATRLGIRVFGSASTILINEIRNATAAGVLLGPGSAGNVLAGNVLDNATNARDSGRGNLWDLDERGNAWSDHLGPDRDGDGIVDVPRGVPTHGRDRFPLVAPP